MELWLETSSDKSFLTNEKEENNYLSAWYDIKNYGTLINASQSNVSNKPTYSSGIKNIPTVKFNGSSYFEFDGSFLNNSDYTIFFLEKRLSNKSNNYFFGDSTVNTENNNIILGYSSNQSIIHSQGGSNSYSSTIESYSDNSLPRVLTFVQSTSYGKKTYINGYLSNENGNKSQAKNILTIAIAKEYEGEIGEIIIFSRALKAEERISAEEYLGKKWSVKVGKSNSSCTDGIVTSDGCQATTSCPTGYTGAGCTSCDTGYTLSGGVCAIIQCSISGVAGVSNTTVNVGTNSLTCDVTGYTGSVSYSCTTGPTASITGSCSCDTSGGYIEAQGSWTSACTGGTRDVSSSSGFIVHTFNSSSTLSCSTSKVANVLVVAGGGGAGAMQWGVKGGGGGGGGLIYTSGYSISSGNTSVQVGAGGGVGTNGTNSQFGTIEATGGGSGNAGGNGSDGGSGGGGAGNSPSRSGGIGTSGQGKNGGKGNYFTCGVSGGGAGSNGGASTSTASGNGGNGLSYAITGSSVTYAGGGAGGAGSGCTTGNGGSGGGGGASTTANGTANTGGGGSFVGAAGSGGSGVVIVSYPIN